MRLLGVGEVDAARLGIELDKPRTRIRHGSDGELMTAWRNLKIHHLWNHVVVVEESREHSLPINLDFEGLALRRTNQINPEWD